MASPGGIQIEWPVLLEWSQALQQIVQAGHLDVFTAYAETGAVVANHALTLYQGYLNGNRLPNGAAIQNPSGNLAKQAELEEADFLDWRLKNDAAYAEAIEKGTKERDLKKMLATAPKARRAKDGSLYLIIPFRHGVPGTTGLKPIPAKVYALAQNLKKSKVTGTFMEPSVTQPGMLVQRNRYHWPKAGGRLTPQALATAGASFREQARYSGMVRFGAKGHGSYMTFRVISQKSKGWILPARPGLWPARHAAETAMRDGQGVLADALLEDLLRLAGLN